MPLNSNMCEDLFMKLIVFALSLLVYIKTLSCIIYWFKKRRFAGAIVLSVLLAASVITSFV